jgi:HD-GYP domain-containing protein (c-di-GMP phosphodiesterase class II)
MKPQKNRPEFTPEELLTTMTGGAPIKPAPAPSSLPKLVEPVAKVPPRQADAAGDAVQAAAVYQGACEVVAWAYDACADGAPLDAVPLRAVVRELVDTLSVPNLRLLTLTALDDTENRANRHSVNVAVLAVAIGLRLELSRSSLSRLGVASLLHDTGKVDVPESVLRRSPPFGDAERELLVRHAHAGARRLLQGSDGSAEAMAAALVALEHHRHADGGGYPALEGAGPPVALSRIVSACDFYDSAVFHRSGQPHPFTAHSALERMAIRGGTAFDPVVLRTLIEVVGCYPPGSLVRLSDGYVAVVVSPGAQDPERPWVVPVAGAPRRIVPGEARDLACEAEQEIEVEAVLEPWSMGVDAQAVLRSWMGE